MNAESKKSAMRFLVLSLIMIAICAGVSFCIAHWVLQGKEWMHDGSHGHKWLQEELGLTHEEAAKIDAFEGDYRTERKVLEIEFNARISQLAQIIRNSDSYSEDVTHAVHQLHEVHGKLQKLSIEHYYDMLSVLPGEKQIALRKLAVEALSQPE